MPGACTHPSGGYPMPARPYPGSAATERRPLCRGRARRVPVRSMGVARHLGSARGAWTYTTDEYVIEFVSLSTKHQIRCMKASRRFLVARPMGRSAAVRRRTSASARFTRTNTEAFGSQPQCRKSSDAGILLVGAPLKPENTEIVAARPCPNIGGCVGRNRIEHVRNPRQRFTQSSRLDRSLQFARNGA